MNNGIFLLNDFFFKSTYPAPPPENPQILRFLPWLTPKKKKNNFF